MSCNTETITINILFAGANHKLDTKDIRAPAWFYDSEAECSRQNVIYFKK